MADKVIYQNFFVELKEFAAKEKLEIVLFAPVQDKPSGKRGCGEFRRAEPIGRKISSDFNQKTLPVRK